MRKKTLPTALLVFRLAAAIFLVANIGLPSLLAWSKEGTVYTTNGSYSDVSSALSDASNGDTIDLPSGSHVWSANLNVDKAVTIRGQGGGGFVSRSLTELNVGNGSKTFTLDANAHNVLGEPVITGGETLTARFGSKGYDTWMEGTVTSYSYPSLTINVTSHAIGTDDLSNPHTDEDFWVILRPPTTTIVGDTDLGADVSIVSLNSNPSGNARLKDVCLESPAAGGGVHSLLRIGGESGQPAVAEGVYFKLHGAGRKCVVLKCNKGVISNWTSEAEMHDGRGSSNYITFWQQFGLYDHASSTTVSKMGDDDLNGDGNVYVENGYAVGFHGSCSDIDANGRIVFRYNVWDHSSLDAHGNDTGSYGMRYMVIHDNAFLFKDDRDAGVDGRTYNVPFWWGTRGAGTGVFTRNYMQNINSSNWGDKSELQCRFFVLDRNAGFFAMWGSDSYAGDDNNDGDLADAPHSGGETVYPASEYPAPRQFGYGYVDGSREYYDVNGGLNNFYSGDPEPVYIWNNTGHSTSLEVRDYDGNDATNPDDADAYVKIDSDGDGSHDGDVITGVAKPGWTEYTYPHPLSSGEGGSPVISTLTTTTLTVGPAP
jgi:hypothetical protein